MIISPEQSPPSTLSLWPQGFNTQLPKHTSFSSVVVAGEKDHTISTAYPCSSFLQGLSSPLLSVLAPRSASHTWCPGPRKYGLGEVPQLCLPSVFPLIPSLLPGSLCGELRGSEGSKEHFELPTCSLLPGRSPADVGQAVEPHLPACCLIFPPLLISVSECRFALGDKQPDCAVPV